MTTGHFRWCWNTLYIYKEDLLWVWTGLGVSFTSANRDSYSCTKHITLRSHRAYNKAGAASLWPVATVKGAELHYICIKKTCYEYELDWGVSIIRTNRDPYSCTKHITLRSHRAYNKAGAASLWPLATFDGAETLYIYIKKTCYEYELDWGYHSQVLTETPTPTPSTSLLGPIEHIIRLELHPYDH